MCHASSFSVTLFETHICFLIAGVEQVEVSIGAVLTEITVMGRYDAAGCVGTAAVGGGACKRFMVA
jgi:hypothetical protein